MYCQRLSCFRRHVGVLERDTNVAAAYTFLFKNISFLLIHIFVVKCSHALNVAQLCSFSHSASLEILYCSRLRLG